MFPLFSLVTTEIYKYLKLNFWHKYNDKNILMKLKHIIINQIGRFFVCVCSYVCIEWFRNFFWLFGVETSKCLNNFLILSSAKKSSKLLI